MANTTKNAVIKSTTLTSNEGNGIPSCMLMLNYGDGSTQGFGGYDLRYYGIDMITKILETLNVEHWEDLVGTHLRVKIQDGFAVGIGHIIEEKWYEPKKEAKN